MLCASSSEVTCAGVIWIAGGRAGVSCCVLAVSVMVEVMGGGPVTRDAVGLLVWGSKVALVRLRPLLFWLRPVG